MAFLLERASVTGLAADRSGGSVAAFEHSYIPLMHRQGFVAPNIGDVPAEDVLLLRDSPPPPRAPLPPPLRRPEQVAEAAMSMPAWLRRICTTRVLRG